MSNRRALINNKHYMHTYNGRAMKTSPAVTENMSKTVCNTQTCNSTSGSWLAQCLKLMMDLPLVHMLDQIKRFGLSREKEVGGRAFCGWVPVQDSSWDPCLRVGGRGPEAHQGQYQDFGSRLMDSLLGVNPIAYSGPLNFTEYDKFRVPFIV